jgi:predicted membrane-bound spermidine synthase
MDGGTSVDLFELSTPRDEWEFLGGASSQRIDRIFYAIFALSGATSLAFETLWFRQAGFTFGNSVWASSLVLSSFMAGIALGNGFAARYASRIGRPIVAYALLELVIAISGVGLVWTLPSMTGAVTSILRPFFDQPWILNPVRLAVGFLVLLVPATAMGATLPLVVRALHRHDPSFGSVLGRLYGVNTLGAMVGAVAGEAFLLEWLGIRGTAIFVAGLGLTAALGALLLARGFPAAAREPDAHRLPLSQSAWRCLIAAFLSGGILLGFEVVWFRFLHLFAHGGGLAFSLMLAAILMGIGLGGYAGGAWVRRNPNAFRHGASLAFLSGCVSVAAYWNFESVIAPYGLEYVHHSQDILWLALCLAFPPSLLSGMLFTLVGTALEREISPDSRATGLLTLFNTVGAVLGSVAGGFILLPYLGMERSFYLLSALYGFVGVLLWSVKSPENLARHASSRWFTAATFLGAMLLFPSGLMESSYLQVPFKRYRGEISQVDRIREGIQQTIIYLRHELDGELVYHRLITDGYSMSSTAEQSRRYMRLFVYLPMAMQPDAKRALLISYGVGETAKALTETTSLEHIDVVDTSREIVGSSDILYPDPKEHPLEDPRVRVHIEDGRYFLRTAREGYDLITGEPPPPKIAGVVSLYTREYFQLVYDRLNQGGINTYWLPAHCLTEADSKAIIRAYCDVFADCALWSGSHLDWMLTGSKNHSTTPGEEAFTRQWRDPIVGRHLRRLGVDTPSLLGTLFMAGPTRLREITGDTEPLIDDFPKRIGNELPSPTIAQVYAPWMDAGRAQRRFRESDYIRGIWPPRLREQTLDQFDFQRMLLDTFRPFGVSNLFVDRHRVLGATPYRFLAVHMMGQDDDTLGAVRRLVASGAAEDRYSVELAIDALADREFAVAVEHIERALGRHPRNDQLFFIYVYALCMSGDLDGAQAVATNGRERFGKMTEGRELRSWLEKTFDLRF